MKIARRGISARIAALSTTAAPSGPGAYGVPPGLIPVWTWRDGCTAEESKRYRRAYDDGSLTEGGDASASGQVDRLLGDRPTNPFTGLAMSQGTGAGEFTYDADSSGAAYTLIGYGTWAKRWHVRRPGSGSLQPVSGLGR